MHASQFFACAQCTDNSLLYHAGRDYGNAEERGTGNVEGSIRTEETGVLAKNTDRPLVMRGCLASNSR